MTNINFLLTISICCQEKWLWEVIKWSVKKKCFDLLLNSLNNFFLRKCMKISMENLYVDIRAQRVNKGPFIQVHLIKVYLYMFKTSTLKVDHRDVVILFYPWFKFFFFFIFLCFKLIIIHYFTQKQWKRIKIEPQHRHEKISNNLSNRKKPLRRFFDPLGLWRWGFQRYKYYSRKVLFYNII